MTPADLLPSVTAEEAIARVARGQRLVDVREQGEWDDVHAPQAQLLPMSVLTERVDELPTDEQILVVCHSGGRSARVTAALIEAGFDAVNVLGGMTAWQSAGGLVVPGAAGEHGD